MGLLSIFKFMANEIFSQKTPEEYISELSDNIVKFSYSLEYNGIVLFLLNSSRHLKVFEEQTESIFEIDDSANYVLSIEPIELFIESNFKSRSIRFPNAPIQVKQEMIKRTLTYLEKEGYFELKEFTKTFSNGHGISYKLSYLREHNKFLEINFFDLIWENSSGISMRFD